MDTQSIPSRWDKVSLGELEKERRLLMRNGFPCGKNNEQGTGVPQLRPMNVDGLCAIDLSHVKYVETDRNLSGFWLHTDDVVFNNTNSRSLVGKTAIWPNNSNEYVLSNHMTFLRLRDRKVLDPDFLSFWIYCLWCSGYFEQKRQQHVNQASISLNRLRVIEIPLPPLAEQRSMVRLLKGVKAAKKYREREIELERERKATLMQHLFIFGVSGAKTTQTEIGEMPRHWDVVALGDKNIARTITGGTPSRTDEEYFEGDIPWVKSGDLNDTRILNTEEKITKKGLDNSNARMLPAGTLLIAMYGATAGKTGLLSIEAATNQAICAVFPVNNSFNSTFLQFYLISIRQKILNARSGGAQPNINQQVIKTLKIPLPPVLEQNQIGEVLGTIDRKISCISHEVNLLEELFKTMLKELVTGRLSAESLMEAGTT